MKTMKALISAVILYAIIFLAASGLMFVFPLGSTSFRITMPILGAVLTFLIAKYFYFKDVSIKDPITDGLALGITFAVVAFVIDVPVMVYGFSAELGWSYFTQWNLMLGYLLTIIVPIVAAYMK